MSAVCRKAEKLIAFQPLATAGDRPPLVSFKSSGPIRVLS